MVKRIHCTHITPPLWWTRLCEVEGEEDEEVPAPEERRREHRVRQGREEMRLGRVRVEHGVHEVVVVEVVTYGISNDACIYHAWLSTRGPPSAIPWLQNTCL